MKNNYLSRVAIAALSMGFVSNVMADNINVSSVSELTSAVSNAKNGDVIVLATGTYKLESEINVENKTLGFVGIGKVVLDGQNQVRVMNVHANANATVENIIIQNGYADNNSNPQRKGAGIRVDGGSLTVKNCKFIDNKVFAQEENWSGGAGIHSAKATVTVSNSEFTGGSAYQGGAMTLVDSNVDVTNCLFKGNNTTFDDVKKDAAKGGAICVRNNNDSPNDNIHNFKNCVFLENIAWGNGGAVSYNVQGGAKGHTTFLGCSFIRNTTNSIKIDELVRTADHNGGAVFIDTDGKFKVDFLSCTIAQNYAAKSGGAVAISALQNKGEDQYAHFVNCTITDNHNLDNCGNGAGVWIHNNAGCGGIDFVNTILTGNWSIKINDDTYAADKEKGEDWRHWEYSDLSTTGSTKQDLISLSNTVIGYLNNAEKYTGTYPNLTIKHTESQAWAEGDTPEGQRGDLDAYNEDYFVYPFNSSAETWTEGELGDMEAAAKYYPNGTFVDQLGDTNDSGTQFIGAVVTSVLDIENYYDVPAFFDDKYISTGIKNITNGVVKPADNACYTLDGIRVAAPTQKGIYILNGKKVVVK